MRPLAAAVASATAMLAAGHAGALEINTGNPDLAVRLDTTARYNAAQRVQQRDSNIGNNYISDEGTYSFDKGDMVANRLDLLTELDVIFKKDSGFRLSAAGWVDRAYGDKSKANPVLKDVLGAPAAPSYIGQNYSPLVKRFYSGPSGEILDAFVFMNFDAGDVPVRVKAGRHTVFWGESLFLGGALHSVSYAQTPIDLQKGFATPQEHRWPVSRGGIVMAAHHAAAGENPRRCHRIGFSCPGRNGRSARRHHAWPGQCARRSQPHAIVRRRELGGRADLDALEQGHVRRVAVQCRGLQLLGALRLPASHARRRQMGWLRHERLLRPRPVVLANLVRGPAWRRPFGANVVFARPEGQCRNDVRR